MKKLFTLLAIIGIATINVYGQILSEDFESGTLPAGWTNESGASDGGWLFGADLGSGYFPIPPHTVYAGTNDDACNCNKANENLITSSFDLPTEGIFYLSLEYFFLDGDYQGANETAKVMISIDDGNSWTQLANLAGVTEWTSVSWSLESFLGESVMLAFRYDDGGGWNFGFAVDDILVKDYSGTEASMVSIDNDNYLESGNYSVSFTVANTATEEITGFDVIWTVDGTETTESFSSSIGFGGSQEFTTSGTFNVVANMDYNIDVVLTSVNESVDNVGIDNQASSVVTGVEYFADRVVVIEEATGTWCGWCPRGAVFMEQMAEDYPNTTFLAAVHNGDPMVVSAYDNGIGSQIPGYPSGLVDRAFGAVDPNEFPDYYLQAMGKNAIIDFTGTIANYNEDSGELIIDVNCKFMASTNIEYRLNAVIVEDGVTGTGSAYNQTNYYSGGSNGPMGGFENLPNPVPAADMVYDHVARAILGGWDGTNNSLPSPIDGLEVNEYTFTWNVPSSYNINNMHIGVMAINQETGAIENAFVPSLVLVGIEEVTNIANFNIYPNPTAGVAHISMNLLESNTVRIEVVNLLGKVVYAEDMGQVAAGNQLFDVDASAIGSGLYMFNIYVGEQKVTKRVSVSK